MLALKLKTQLDFQKDNPFLKLKARSLFLWFFIISIVVGISFGLVSNLIGIKFDDPMMSYILYCFIFVLLCLWIQRRYHQLKINLRDVVGRLPNGYRWLPLVGLVLILLLFSAGVGLLTFYVLSLIAPSFFEELQKSISEANTPSSSAPVIYTLLEIFTCVIVAPVTEEFIFRGFLLHRWSTKWGIQPAIIISSLVFGFLHLNPLGISVVGIIFALLYLKTRTLIIPIAAHAINNSFAIALKLLATSVTSDTSNSIATTHVISSYLPVGLFLISVSAPFLIFFIYKKWPSQSASLPYFNNSR